MACLGNEKEISFTIKRGTTPSIGWSNLNVDVSNAEAVYFTLKQSLVSQTIIYEFDKENLDFGENNSVVARLTQEQTLGLVQGVVVSAELTALLGNERLTTDIVYGMVKDTQKDEVI